MHLFPAEGKARSSNKMDIQKWINQAMIIIFFSETNCVSSLIIMLLTNDFVVSRNKKTKRWKATKASGQFEVKTCQI